MRKFWRCCSMLLFPTLAIIAVAFFFPESKHVFNALRFVKNASQVVTQEPFVAVETTQSTQLQDSNYGNHVQQMFAGRSAVLVVTLCGQDAKQEEQVLVMLKSVVLTASGAQTIHAVLITDSEDSYMNIAHGVANWPSAAYSVLTLSYIPLWYPKRKQWMKTFRTLCTTERLYYPFILKEYDAVIHLDTDIVFLRPLHELWNYFSVMNSQQFAALAPEHMDPEDAYYNSPLNKVPYFGKLGLNAGVMLMNLTRMRGLQDQNWIRSMHDIYKKYQHAPLHFADQDMLNVYFHDNPDSLLELPCNWNYRNDFCRFKKNTCPAAAGQDGVGLLHGNRGVFLSSDEPAFRAMYEAFLKYNWTSDVRQSLVEPMLKSLDESRSTMCGVEPDVTSYTKYLKSRFAGA